MANVSIQCEDAAHYLLKGTGISASVTTPTYPIERWTSVGLQINVANSSTLTLSAQILVSNDNVNFGNYGSAISITGDDVITVNLSSIAFRHLRVELTFSAGSADIEILTNAKQG